MDGNTSTPAKQENEQDFQILQKIEDMWKYAYPIMKKWSIADKYALGNDMMHIMNELIELAVEVKGKHFKKTSLTNLDIKNQTLKMYIKISYESQILKGVSSYKEWTRRTEEIGKMIGGYIGKVYEEETAKGNTAKPKQKPSGSGRNYYSNR